MARQLHSAPAAAAITLVICIAAVAFMIFVLLPGASLGDHHALAIPSVGTHVRNITRAVGVVLMLGYFTGVIGWVVTLALRQDGMHRLASVRSARLH